MSHAIEFIETTMFTRQIKQIATDDELKELQKEGKSGSARVIYFLATAEVIYLVMAYPKSTKDSITDAEKAELKKLTQRLKDEV